LDRIPRTLLRSVAFSEGYDLYDKSGELLSDKKLCSLINSTKPTKKWLNQQRKYINNLNKNNRELVHYYTFHGNNVINATLRGNYREAYKAFREDEDPVVPMKYIGKLVRKNYDDEDKDYDADQDEDFPKIIDGLKRLSYDLNEIILSAPVLDKDIVVYRGVDSDKFINKKSTGITSTSLWIETAMIYPEPLPGRNGVNGYLLFISIPKGFPCLFLGWDDHSQFTWEKEILLPVGTEYLSDNKFQEIEIAETRMGDINGFCMAAKNSVIVLMNHASVIGYS